MTDHFDPYHKWLGIPPAEQPPDLYRLLGVPRFESDPDVIANAADQRMAHLRTFQTGHNAALSQQLLNQLAAARVVLLHKKRRIEYDTHLREQLATPAAGPQMDTVSGRMHKTPPHGPDARDVRGSASQHTYSKEPGTSERLNALFENLSVEEQAAFGKLRRSLGKKEAPAAQHKKLFATDLWQRYRHIAFGGLIAGSIALTVAFVGVLLLHRGSKREAAKSGAVAHGETVDLRDFQDDRAVLILRWPEHERVGARLTIDGLRATPANSSPAHLEFKLPPGNRRVCIVRDGYLPFEETMPVRAGTRIDRTILWQPVLESDGTGLWAEYYNGRSCEELIFKRIDPNVQFLWGSGSPDERVPPDDFSVRWTGYLKAPFPGRYKLRAIIDDFMQVSIDGRLVLWGPDGTSPHPETEVELTGQPQTIKIEYWEGRSLAVACLNWVPPGDFVEQAIPP